MKKTVPLSVHQPPPRLPYHFLPSTSRKWQPSARAAVCGTLLLLALGIPTRQAFAHAGHPPEPLDLLQAWSWEPGVLFGIGGLAWLYLSGLSTLWKRAGIGRGIRIWQALAFAGSILALFVALVSPLDAVSEALFSAHMVQHLILMFLAAPLLVFSAPQVALSWALPRAWRRGMNQWWHRRTLLRPIWKLVSSYLSVWLIYALVLWLWHMPLLYQAAVESHPVHTVEHACFFGAALLFWWSVVRTHDHSREFLGIGLLFVFTTALQSGLLGALLTFTSQPWYPIYEDTVSAWGLTALQDQQLAGVIMWVPAGLIYLLTFLLLLGGWLRSNERLETDGLYRGEEPI